MTDVASISASARSKIDLQSIANHNKRESIMETGTTATTEAPTAEDVAVSKIEKALGMINAVPLDKDPEGRIDVLALAALMVESLHETKVIGTPNYDKFKAQIIDMAKAVGFDGR
jgi:hypothetical protein